MNLKLVSCLIIINLIYAEKVLIITAAYNRPDFIEWQHALYKKFLKDDYELVIFNDAKEEQFEKQIENICKNLNIQCLKVPKNIHNSSDASTRTSDTIQYSLNKLGFQFNGIVAIIDSDMFLTKSFSIAEFMKGCDIAGLDQSRKHIKYLWNGIIFFYMNKIPDKTSMNFSCGFIDQVLVDSGGFLYYYLVKYPNLKIKYLDQIFLNDQKLRFYTLSDIDFKYENYICLQCKSLNNYNCMHNYQNLLKYGFNQYQITFLQAGIDNVEFFINNIFLHYRSGTNWNNQSAAYHKNKTALISKFFEQILNVD